MAEARRYNKNKIRMELLPPGPLREIAKVYTIGAEKYSDFDKEGNLIYDGADNWRLGMSWKSVIGSVERHINKFKQGEDFDSDFPPELLKKYGSTYHLANAAWGLMALLEYYKIHPEYDDRNHNYLSQIKIGLDIDGVLGDWQGAWNARHGHSLEINNWNFDRHIKEKLSEVSTDKTFWVDEIKPLIDPKDIPFEPHCYITARGIPKEWTEEWIDKNGFPQMPVYTVDFGQSKVDIAKEIGIDWFIDDRFENFAQLNAAGICTFLMDRPWNRRYNVGYKRIHSFSELF